MDSRLRSAPYPQPDAANHSANQKICAEICENLRRAAHEALNSYNVVVAEEGLLGAAEKQLRLHRQNLQELTDKYKQEYDEAHNINSGTWLSTTARLSRLRYVNEKLKQDPEARRAQQGIKACAQSAAHRQNIVSMSKEIFDSAKQEFSMLLQASLNLRQDEIQCVFEWHIDVRRAPP